MLNLIESEKEKKEREKERAFLGNMAKSKDEKRQGTKKAERGKREKAGQARKGALQPSMGRTGQWPLSISVHPRAHSSAQVSFPSEACALPPLRPHLSRDSIRHAAVRNVLQKGAVERALFPWLCLWLWLHDSPEGNMSTSSSVPKLVS